MGKSRLVEELATWAEQQGFAVARTRRYATEGGLTLAPVIDWLRSDWLRSALTKLEPVWLAELTRLLPELRGGRPDLPLPEAASERWQRARLFEALARAVTGSREPLLLVIDDLQWCDAETLEWLYFLLQFKPAARLLVVGTLRPEEVDDRHPAVLLRLKLERTGQWTGIELGPLTAEETAALAAEVARHELERSLLDRLVHDTEGNPLFVVETVRMQVAAGAAGEGTPAALPTGLSGRALHLPPKVLAVIQWRLARLSPGAHDLLSLAAVVGRAFTFEVLAQASSGDSDALVRSLDELWQRRIVRAQGGGAYDFGHDRIRDVAYAQIGQARRRLLHHQVAQALERIYATKLDEVAARIAAQYRQAGEAARAATYYFRAAREAQFGYAYEETMAHLQQGLAILQDQPRSKENVELEIAMTLTRGRFLGAREGWEAATRSTPLQRHAGCVLPRTTWRSWCGPRLSADCLRRQWQLSAGASHGRE